MPSLARSYLPLPARISATTSFGRRPRLARVSASVSIGSRSSMTSFSLASISRVLAAFAVTRVAAKTRARPRSGSASTSSSGRALRTRAGSTQAAWTPRFTLAKAIRTARQTSTSRSGRSAASGAKRW
ncbi:hypothetical protein BE20_02805 [Sorangium cellulosum]|nr:hypothetical protein BE20_02805 [Sorangium cellulosum]